MKRILRSFIMEQGGPCRVLNVACGSCREVVEVIKENPTLARQLLLTILDQDRDALIFAQQALRNSVPQISVEPIQVDVLTLIQNQRGCIRRLGKYDLVYSIGLADYLPDHVLRKFIGFFYELLASDARFIITHKDRDAGQHAPVLADWFCDWKFHARNKREFCSLIHEAVPQASLVLETDNSGTIIFCTMMRP
jgi:hypothetical protein